MGSSQDGLFKKNTIPLFKVLMNPKVIKPLKETLFSGWIGQGPKVDEFERKLSILMENENCLTVSSGTAGLSLSLRLAGVQPGDDVISTPWTCNATTQAILLSGANVVWADIGQDLNISPQSIKESITSKTKAIMVVHIGGYPCDMEEIYKISKEYNIPVIEDSAQAFGSIYKDTMIGECKYSDFCVLSFQAIKHLTSVDGGCIFTKNKEDYIKGKILRWFGIDRTTNVNPRSSYPIQEWGYKYHMSDVCATIGMSNLNVVDISLLKSRDNARDYKEELINIPGLTLLPEKKDRLSSYWMFAVLVENRSNFIKMMTQKGIEVSIVQARNDKFPYTKQFQKELPMMDKLDPHIIYIPCGFWVTEKDRKYIVKTIQAGW
jgi:perosamine synthetase